MLAVREQVLGTQRTTVPGLLRPAVQNSKRTEQSTAFSTLGAVVDGRFHECLLLNQQPVGRCVFQNGSPAAKSALEEGVHVAVLRRQGLLKIVLGDQGNAPARTGQDQQVQPDLYRRVAGSGVVFGRSAVPLLEAII